MTTEDRFAVVEQCRDWAVHTIKTGEAKTGGMVGIIQCAVMHAQVERERQKEAELAALQADNERLRGLIKECMSRSGIRHSFGIDSCPWCTMGGLVEDDHDDDCPAFHPDGAVR